jgi:hypothetical protein
MTENSEARKSHESAGVWVTKSRYGSTYIAWETELAALRHAVKDQAEAKFVTFGVTFGEAWNA